MSPSVTRLALDFPASPMIATVGADIVASADPTCTDAEKASLVTAEAGLEEAAAAVEDAYNEAQVSPRYMSTIFLRYFLNIRGRSHMAFSLSFYSFVSKSNKIDQWVVQLCFKDEVILEQSLISIHIQFKRPKNV